MSGSSNQEMDSLLEQISKLAMSLAPENSRKLWLWINAICAVWSTLLIIALCTEDTVLDRLENTQYYLVWSFGTTLVWCLESGLTAWDHRQRGTWDWAQIVEVVLAIYFLYSSIRLFRKWRKPDEDVESEFGDIILTALPYWYQIWMGVYGRPPTNAGSKSDEYETII